MLTACAPAAPQATATPAPTAKPAATNPPPATAMPAPTATSAPTATVKPTSAPTAAPQATSTAATGTVTDDSNTISITAPSSWEYGGGAWKDTWTINGQAYPFTAQTLTVSPNFKAYDAGWDTQGIFVATSSDWGNIGGFSNLLEGVAGFYTACKAASPKDYASDNYTGQVVFYTNCGPNKTNAAVLAVRPNKNPTSYLMLIELKYANDADFNGLTTILDTLNVNK